MSDRQVTALLTIKVCPGCGGRAPVGWPIDHAPRCPGGICRTEVGPWPMEPGDEVVTLRLDDEAQL